jgi:Tfp pilus assembly ATPase PilU
MQLLDEHLWNLYDTGTITYEEMLDKSRQPGALQDKAKAKIEAMRGGKHKHKKKAAQQEMEDLGDIIRSS